MNWLRKSADDRFHEVMHTLLYPGVLGSLIYAYPDNIVSKKVPFTWVDASLAAALMLAFVFDYLHSISREAKAYYSHGTFIADLCLVVLMFIAGQKILGTPMFPSVQEFWFLGLARAFGWFWEHTRARADGEDPTPRASTCCSSSCTWSAGSSRCKPSGTAASGTSGRWRPSSCSTR